MKKFILGFAHIAWGALAFTQGASAAVNIDRTRIIFNAAEKSVSIMLDNQSKDLPYLAQVWLEDAAGQKISSPLVALPPMQRIDAGQKSQIRVLQLPQTAALPKDRESLFYFNVREVPPKSELANVMQVAIQSRIKLFYRPVAITSQAKGAWQEKISVKPSANGLTISNPTPFYITLGYLGKDNTGSFRGFDSLMLAPFGTETLSGSEYVSSTYRIGYMDDYGGLQINAYQCKGTVCQMESKSEKK
jgi:P pilus assembly chaperone PapD